MANKHTFCRQLLKETLNDVRQRFSDAEIKAAWVIGSNGRYEFHGPNKFYTYVRADCVADAKANGWSELLQSKD